jgi:gliding motility-associated protein GldL
MSKLGKVTGFKRYLHLASCFGASIVIIGALFKIQHWPGANAALIAGLGTEAVLFVLFGIDIPHEDVDWTLAYPELAGMGHAEQNEELEQAETTLPISNQLDNLLADAKIGPELLESLGSGMRNLGESANKMADISNATVATNEYVDSVKNASKNVSQLADTYSKAANSISTLAESGDAGSSIGDSLVKVSKNLSALNATYELQLQGNQTNLEATSKFYDGLNELMKNLTDSVDDTKKYRQEMASLSNNLTALNTVYGNMLSAMNAKA